MRGLIGWAAGVLACVGSLPALAQTVTQPPQIPAGANHLELTPSGEIVYDTDVARSDAQEAALRGLQLSDEIYEPALAIDFLRAIGNQSVFLEGTGGYDYYGHDTVLDSARINLTGGAQLRLASCQAAIYDNYAVAQTSLEDITSAAVHNDRTDESLGLNADCSRPIGVTPLLTVTTTWATNSNPVLEVNNVRSTTVRGGVAYLQPALGQISLIAQYETFDFPNRVIAPEPGAPTEAYRVYAGGVKFDHHIGARIETTLQFFYSNVQPNIPGGGAFSGPTYLADVSYHATSRITATLHAQQDVEPSQQLGSTLTREQQYLGKLEYDVNPRLTLSGGGSYDNKAFEGTLLDPALDLTSQQTTDVFGNAELHFARRFVLILDAREENRRANLEAFSYASTRVSVTLEAHL
jgi:Putative beta-barrel porin 2